MSVQSVAKLDQRTDGAPAVSRAAGDRDPLMPDVGVVGLVPDRWTWPWMPRHQVLTRLGQYFHVVWMEPPQGWRELWLDSEDAETAALYDTRSFASGFSIYRHGKWLPKLYRPEFLANYLERKRLQTAVDLLKQKGCRTIVLYLWRPEFLYALSAVDHDLSLYHIDDEYSFSVTDQPVDPQEMALIERADQVIVHSPALMEKKGGVNPQTILVPNGVDYDIFAQAAAEPDDMQNIPHPRVGYAGVIKKQLDIDLLLGLARRHPDWSVVMVGPFGVLEEDAPKYEALEKMANVYFLGDKHRNDLPAYMQHMDVCMMCYRVNDYTKYIYPLKLHEYLAGGRPVVAAPIRSLLGFADHIKLASTEDEWSQAIQECLAPSEMSPASVERRQQVAHEHDWYSLTNKIAGVMCQRLGRDFFERFSSLSGH